jgi:hypothetical protein
MVNWTDPQRRGNNPDDGLGVEIKMDDACVTYTNEGKQNATDNLVPNNGEYEYTKTSGDCNYCMGCMPKRGDWGAGCSGFFWQCASVGGGIPYYKRVSYLAPKKQCCTGGGVTTIGDKTCHPDYLAGPNSTSCDDIFSAKCDTIEGVMTDQCKTWCSRNSSKCDSKIREYCSLPGNLDNQVCKDKAVKIGDMDYAVDTWCASHPDDRFCSCYKAINTQVPEGSDIKRALSRPECYVTECSSGMGYKYTNMRDGKSCPTVEICDNSITVGSATSSVFKNITQTCNQSIGDDTKSATNTLPPTTLSKFLTDPVGTTKDAFTGPNAQYFIIFIVLILSIIFGIVALSSDDESTTSPYVSSDDSWF